MHSAFGGDSLSWLEHTVPFFSIFFLLPPFGIVCILAVSELAGWRAPVAGSFESWNDFADYKFQSYS